MKKGYKKTELGWIPEEWTSKKLDEITEIITKGTTPSTYGFEFIDSGINFIKIENILSNGKVDISNLLKISKECNEKLKRSQIKEGDILFSIAGSLGKTIIVDKSIIPCNTNQAISIIRLKNDFNRQYINKFLCSQFITSYIERISTIGAQPNISLKQVGDINVILPPLKEQEKIADILSTVDSQINDTDKLIEKTKELKKGLMQRLLTKGIRHKNFKKTEVGEIPIEWEVKRLFEVANFNNGKAHEKNISEEGQFVVVNSKFISTEGEVKKYSNENICPLNKGDIVIVMSDVPNGKAIGKCYLIDEENKYTLNQRIGCLKTEYMHKKFLFYYLNRNKYYLKFDDGVKQTNLKKEEVLGCPVIVPNIEEQKNIVNILSEVDNKILDYKNKKIKLEELKKGLMQQLLTGKIRVV